MAGPSVLLRWDNIILSGLKNRKVERERERERERDRQRLGREERSLAFGSSCVRVICVVHGVCIKRVRRCCVWNLCVGSSESDVCVLQVLFVGSQCDLLHPRFAGLSEPETGQLSGGWFTACVFLLMSSARICALHNGHYQCESVVLQ